MKKNKISLIIDYMIISICLLSGCAEDNSTKDGTSQGGSSCGNKRLDEGEVCDGLLGAPESCAFWGATTKWVEGGRPGCAADCRSFSLGTCQIATCGNINCGSDETCIDEVCRKNDELCGGFVCTKDEKCFEGVCLPYIKPEDREDCTDGKCDEVSCGNGVLDKDEVCDGKIGVPLTCVDWDSTKDWTGGRPACAGDCKSLTAGSCSLESDRTITFMNYNVLFEYTAWSSADDPFINTKVIDRATDLYNNLKRERNASADNLPAIIAVVESSPLWHAADVTAMFEDLGYVWVDNKNYRDASNYNTNWDYYTRNPNEGAYFHTNILYQNDRFELLENNWKSLSPYHTPLTISGTKTIAFCAVLREKVTEEIFIACSTHWEPNMVYGDDPTMSQSAGWIARHEFERIQGVKDSYALIKTYTDKYPGAHVLYGGDLNTIDLHIIYNNEIASSVLGSNNKELASRANIIINYAKDGSGKAFPYFEDDFVGAHEFMTKHTGLLDARSNAIKFGVAENDAATMLNPRVANVFSQLGFNIIIDYAFYSSDMTLTSYEVLNSEKYSTISDHFPVRTKYIYHVSD